MKIALKLTFPAFLLEDLQCSNVWTVGIYIYVSVSATEVIIRRRQKKDLEAYYLHQEYLIRVRERIRQIG